MELEAELAAEYGPIPDEAREQVRKEWEAVKRRMSQTD